MQVLKTKLSRPSMMNDRAMQRPLLLSQMVEHCQSSLVFIHAAAGYGKTTLMYQLSEALLAQTKQVSWLTIDSDDNDPIRLYQYLRLALLGSNALYAVAHGQIYKQNIIELTQKVAEIEADIVLFIDELDALENQECLDIVWWLYQYLPSNCHLVISSRIKPNWSFTKEYLSGRLKWVTEAHLSIKPQESRELIHFLHQQNFDDITLTTELAEQLIDKTEGWLTGIQLTNLYLKNYHDAASVIQSLSGVHTQIVDYLSEQVFAQLPPSVQIFLLHMSVLKKVNLPLVQAVTEHPHAQSFLGEIQQRGLFILAIDEQHYWYRVHHLFREFLENRFKATDIKQYEQAHHRAALWYQTQGFLMEAIYHAQQAHDQVMVLRLLEDVSRELVLDGRVYTLLELVKQIPEDDLGEHFHLLYDTIWVCLLTHQTELANHYIQLWDTVKSSENLKLHDDQHGLAPMLALLEDELPKAYTLAQKNLLKLPETAYFTRGPLIGIGVLYHICLGHITEARKLLIQTRATYVQGHNAYGLIFTDCIDATCERLMGNLSLAEEKFNQIGKGPDYQKLKIDQDNQIAVDAITSSLKADLYYEMNKIDLAEQALESFNGGAQLVIPDMVIIGYVLQFKLAHLRGDIAAKQSCLTQSQIKTTDWSIPRLAQTVQQVYEHQILLDQISPGTEHDLDCAADILDSAPVKNITNLLIGDDLLIYRELILCGKIEQALHGLKQEAQQCKVYPLRQIRIQLLQALAFYHFDQQQLGLDYLQKALVALMPTQAVRIVLDEDPLIWDMLSHLSQHLSRQKQKHTVVLLDYIQQLQKLNQVEDSDDVLIGSSGIEALSKREIQILEKLSRGCTDAEISESIFLSINTVKWHLRKIYNKLQVRSRMEAVNEAKKQGLIE